MAATSVVPTTTLGPIDSSAIANQEAGESMGKVSPTVVLPFNSLCDDAMEITRPNLVTKSACLLPVHIADLVDEGCSNRHMSEEAKVANMEDQGVNGRPEPLLDNSSPVISNCRSVPTVTEDLLLQYVASESGPPRSLVDTLKRAPSVCSEDDSSSAAGDLNVKDPLATSSGSNAELVLIEGQIKEEIQCTGGRPRSSLVSDCMPLWGHVSICGRRPEIEDAVAIVPRFSEIPLQLLAGPHLVDGGLETNPPQSIGHFFGVYDGHGGAQVLLFVST